MSASGKKERIIITLDGRNNPNNRDALARALLAGFRITDSWTSYTGGMFNHASTYVVLRKEAYWKESEIKDIRAGEWVPEEWFNV